MTAKGEEPRSDDGDHGAIIVVELCGVLADLAGQSLALEIGAGGCTVDDLLAQTSRRNAGLAAQIASGRVKAFINEVTASTKSRVMPGDVVALFPPVSGG